ncbi:metallophosphoesterase [Rheinheimera sp. 1928-s]|uniref:metallophosphoesterase family protein n=1 Tax=Rheinheimera sp. 1928-s TaxID=3033803 RepID=UPI00261B5B2B|nr:metallophosphoesterase [Rheinheimera sp. 1928-s]MDF3125922.1 metallophosphoesterase [Rheinheimera sp. 1928-s]
MKTLCFGFVFALFGLPALATPASAPQQIAFLPDVHFHDVYANFPDGSFKGLQSQTTGKAATIRTMAAQLQSTRLFNENYFALRAALDDLVRRNVKLVVLPGDFSDDGQTAHIRGLKQILQHYSSTHGLKFLLTLGNHDPVRPYAQSAGKPDYLGPDGRPLAIYSPGSEPCVGKEKSVVCTEEVKELGYAELMTELSDFGFYPKADDLYWETPFSNYDQSNYHYSQALAQSDLTKRQLEICLQGAGGAFKKPHHSHCQFIADASYLVEPVQGLWLLAIDANVYKPKANYQGKGQEAAAFEGSGNAGYNAMFDYKPAVMQWVKHVAKRAKAQGKTLITFSHYPMIEFYQGQTEQIATLLGEQRGQLSRSPQQQISHQLADLGVQLHIGGHMHLNNTAVVKSNSGNSLVNIQAPSLAAYVPAYKLLTLTSKEHIKVQTIVLEQVPGFDQLFEHYQKEWQQLKQDKQPLWDASILQSKNYRDFANGHLRELTRLRFLPKDWPDELRQLLLGLNGEQMLVLSELDSSVTLKEFSPAMLQQLSQSPEWQQARQKATTKAATAGLKLEDFTHWTGFDLVLDFYRLQNAGELALADISAQRLQHYGFFTALLQNVATKPQAQNWQNWTLPQYCQSKFSGLFQIIHGFLQGQPNGDFMLNIQTGELTSLNNTQAP